MGYCNPPAEGASAGIRPSVRSIGDLLTAIVDTLDRLGVQIEPGSVDATGLTAIIDGGPVRIGFGYDADRVRLYAGADDDGRHRGTIDGCRDKDDFVTRMVKGLHVSGVDPED